MIFSPPFRDPFNYNFDPMIVTGLDMVGAAMHHRFLQEGKPGFTMRSGASYSTWWNGGLRTTAYFQNIIGLLTEIIGNPTPTTDSGDDEHDPAARRSAGADRAAGVEVPAVDRLLGDGQLRGDRPRVALQGPVPLQHLQDGLEPDRARLARSLDDLERRHGAPARRRCPGGAGRRAGGGRGGAGRRAGAAAPAGGDTPDAPQGGGGRGRGGIPDGAVQPGAEGSGRPRSARVRHPGRPARLPDGHEVHQHAALRRRRSAPGERGASARTARTIRRAPTS